MKWRKKERGWYWWWRFHFERAAITSAPSVPARRWQGPDPTCDEKTPLCTAQSPSTLFPASHQRWLYACALCFCNTNSETIAAAYARDPHHIQEFITYYYLSHRSLYSSPWNRESRRQWLASLMVSNKECFLKVNAIDAVTTDQSHYQNILSSLLWLFVDLQLWFVV